MINLVSNKLTQNFGSFTSTYFIPHLMTTRHVCTVLTYIINILCLPYLVTVHLLYQYLIHNLVTFQTAAHIIQLKICPFINKDSPKLAGHLTADETISTFETFVNKGSYKFAALNVASNIMKYLSLKPTVEWSITYYRLYEYLLQSFYANM
jgi:hypothetical protein